MVSGNLRLAMVIGTALLLRAVLANASPVAPTDDERKALDGLRGQISGQIVWESNRNGYWQLYAMNADGTGLRQLTSGPGQSTQARFSLDGKRLLFTRSRWGEPPEVWMSSSDGSDAQKLIGNAASPEWRRGDAAIEFQRQPKGGENVWQTWQYDCASKTERLIFPPPGVFFKPQIAAATGNDDGTRFAVSSPDPLGVWVVSADGRVQKLVHEGCGSRVSADQRYVYGVRHAGRFIRFNLADGEGAKLFNVRFGLWSHTYFPYVPPGGEWLIYAACPPEEHDMDTSDYELFIVRLKDWETVGAPVRLTFDSRTDRWPTLFVAPQSAPGP